MGSIIRKNNFGPNGESVIEAPSLLLPIQHGSRKLKIIVSANYMWKDDDGKYSWAPGPTLQIFEKILSIADNIANVSVSISELPLEEDISPNQIQKD